MDSEKKDSDKKSSSGADEDVVSESLKKQAELFGMPYFAKDIKIKKDVLGIISEELAKKYKMAAFEKDGNSVKVCMLDPGNFEALNILRFISENSGLEFELYLTEEKFFLAILRQ
ncbi:MAG: hypothetical protein ACD_11C00074G0001, partial [uncultured bacterium]